MGKACECGCVCIAIYIKLIIMIISIIIYCNTLLPVINYSKMEKPDTEIDDLDDLYDLYTIDPEVKEEYLCYLFFPENKDTVSSFKMKEIKAFSIGLFTLIMI